jgi:hypothetical protein
VSLIRLPFQMKVQTLNETPVQGLSKLFKNMTCGLYRTCEADYSIPPSSEINGGATPHSPKSPCYSATGTTSPLLALRYMCTNVSEEHTASDCKIRAVRSPKRSYTCTRLHGVIIRCIGVCTNAMEEGIVSFFTFF